MDLPGPFVEAQDDAVPRSDAPALVYDLEDLALGPVALRDKFAHQAVRKSLQLIRQEVDTSLQPYRLQDDLGFLQLSVGCRKVRCQDPEPSSRCPVLLRLGDRYLIFRRFAE